MKTNLSIIAVVLTASCGAAAAAEYGTVVSTTPVMAQIAVPQQVCRDEQQLVPPRTSGAGSLLGAIVGGVAGANVGGGVGRAAATGVGVVAGAILGDHVEAANTPPAETTVRNCQTTTSYENRVIGYDVVYDYNGQRYSARVPQDPGARIALNVNVAPAGAAVAVAPPPTVAVGPPIVYAQAPGYPYYYGAPAVAVAPRVVVGGYWRHGF